jgi:hypothetical protein
MFPGSGGRLRLRNSRPQELGTRPEGRSEAPVPSVGSGPGRPVGQGCRGQPRVARTIRLSSESDRDRALAMAVQEA